MQGIKLPIIVSIISSILLAASPLAASADDVLPPPIPAPLAPVLITEVLAGQAAPDGDAKSEFIELHNTTDQPIDLSAHNWRLFIASSSATSWTPPYRTVALTGTILPGESYVVASKYTQTGQTVQYLPDLARDWFSYGIAATGGHIRLVYEVSESDGATGCVLADVVVDQVEWSLLQNGVPSSPSIDGRTVFSTLASVGIPAASSLQRLLDQSGAAYRDRDNDTIDFVVGSPTPGAQNLLAETTDPGVSAQPTVPLPQDTCPPPQDDPEDPGSTPTTPPEEDWPPAIEEPPASDPQDDTSQPTIPAGNTGLKSPSVSELLPNPASPLTDENDEFIELYNPNEAYFDLSGYILEVGLSTKRRYTIPAGTKIPPRTFLALFSARTNLALSNSGSQASLLDPLGRILATTEVYGSAKDGQAWVFAGGVWQWTIKPTPNAVNVVSSPVVKSKSTTKKGTSNSTSASKTGANGQPNGLSVEDDIEDATAVAASTGTPLHPGVLALIAVSALLYGAYEYRRDVANRIYQFRTNRAARRAIRQGAEGR